jgi:predicted membrane protein
MFFLEGGNQKMPEVDVKGLVVSIILVIVGFVTVFYLVGGTAGTIVTASQNISGSGLPLASLFSSSGVLLIIFMIAIFVALLLMAFKMWKK